MPNIRNLFYLCSVPVLRILFARAPDLLLTLKRKNNFERKWKQHVVKWSSELYQDCHVLVNCLLVLSRLDFSVDQIFLHNYLNLQKQNSAVVVVVVRWKVGVFIFNMHSKNIRKGLLKKRLEEFVHRFAKYAFKS